MFYNGKDYWYKIFRNESFDGGGGVVIEYDLCLAKREVILEYVFRNMGMYVEKESKEGSG